MMLFKDVYCKLAMSGDPTTRVYDFQKMNLIILSENCKYQKLYCMSILLVTLMQITT